MNSSLFILHFSEFLFSIKPIFYKVVFDNITVLKHHGTLAELGNVVLVGYKAYGAPSVVQLLE